MFVDFTFIRSFMEEAKRKWRNWNEYYIFLFFFFVDSFIFTMMKMYTQQHLRFSRFMHFSFTLSLLLFCYRRFVCVCVFVPWFIYKYFILSVVWILFRVFFIIITCIFYFLVFDLVYFFHSAHKTQPNEKKKKKLEFFHQFFPVFLFLILHSSSVNIPRLDKMKLQKQHIQRRAHNK